MAGARAVGSWCASFGAKRACFATPLRGAGKGWARFTRIVLVNGAHPSGRAPVGVAKRTRTAQEPGGAPGTRHERRDTLPSMMQFAAACTTANDRNVRQRRRRYAGSAHSAATTASG